MQSKKKAKTPIQEHFQFLFFNLKRCPLLRIEATRISHTRIEGQRRGPGSAFWPSMQPYCGNEKIETQLTAATPSKQPLLVMH
jgi:hypothetical protein